MYRRDARTLDAAVKQKKISAERAKNKGLQYYEIKFVNIHYSGGNYKGRRKGMRKSNTFKMNCTFNISLRCSNDVNPSQETTILARKFTNFIPRSGS